MPPVIHALDRTVSPSSVGRVLPHEHLLCDFSAVTGQLDHILNDVALAVDEVQCLVDLGVTCLVEVTPPDLGRRPADLARIAAESGLDIVMGTGWYRGSFYPSQLERTSTQQMAEAMVVELVEGVDGTAFKAGVIGEIGVDRDFVSGIEERVLRASGRASNLTGAPITTHTGVYPVGIDQLDILAEEGVDPERIIIGHVDMCLDIDYHRELLRRGAFVQFDTIGRTHLNPDERRAQILVQLLREGWGERILMSSDRCFRSDLKSFGGAGYGHVLTSFVPRLTALGVDEHEIDMLTRHNPVRALAW
ncbi:phosphotriesterase family protein [Aeromicrobium sp. P5_D10]